MKTIISLIAFFIATESGCAMGWKPKPAPSPKPTATATPRPTATPTASGTPSPSPTATVTPTPGQVELKPFYTGIIALFATDKKGQRLGDVSGNPEWKNENVDGCRFRTTWEIVQPTKDSFDWAAFDAFIALANANGKEVSINVGSGVNSPEWIYADGAYKYFVKNPDPRGDDGVGYMPLPWDPKYQAQYIDFVTKFGARYDGNPAVGLIIVNGMTRNNATMYFGDADDEATMPHEGFPDVHTAYLDGVKKIITAHLNAFKKTRMVICNVRPFPSDKGRDDLNHIIDWMTTTFPGRIGTWPTSLFAVVENERPPLQKVTYPHGFQCFQKVIGYTDWTKLYQKGTTVPSEQPPYLVILGDTLWNGVAKGAQAIEVYLPDLRQESAKQLLSEVRTKLKANVPAGH